MRIDADLWPPYPAHGNRRTIVLKVRSGHARYAGVRLLLRDLIAAPGDFRQRDEITARGEARGSGELRPPVERSRN
jgi:hypothetical protein